MISARRLVCAVAFAIVPLGGFAAGPALAQSPVEQMDGKWGTNFCTGIITTLGKRIQFQWHQWDSMELDANGYLLKNLRVNTTVEEVTAVEGNAVEARVLHSTSGNVKPGQRYRYDVSPQKIGAYDYQTVKYEIMSRCSQIGAAM